MKKIFIVLAFVLSAMSISAQQALNARVDVQTATVNPDRSVTIQLLAPKAKKVQIDGDLVGGVVDMKSNKKGLWTYTTAPLTPELYTYRLNVDGLYITDPGTVHTVRDISRVMNMVLIEDDKSVYGVHDVPHGTVLSTWYSGVATGQRRRVSVYLPAGYFESNKRYPVLYLLHGSGGDEQAWLELGRTAQILDNQIASGKAQPMIVVMPNGNMSEDAAPGQGTKGFVVPDIPAEHRMDGFFEQNFDEIVEWTDGTFRTIKKAKYRAITGLSMGGYHSFWIGINNPKCFHHVGVFSGVYFKENMYSASDIYDNHEEKLATFFAQKPDMRIYIGDKDFLYQQNVQMRAYLTEHNYPYIYTESGGGHEWRNWRNYLTDYVTHLF